MNAFVQPAVIMSPLLKMIHSIVNLSFQKVLSLQSCCISGHLLTLRRRKESRARTHGSLVCTSLQYSMNWVCIEDKQLSRALLLVSPRAADCEL